MLSSGLSAAWWAISPAIKHQPRFSISHISTGASAGASAGALWRKHSVGTESSDPDFFSRSHPLSRLLAAYTIHCIEPSRLCTIIVYSASVYFLIFYSLPLFSPSVPVCRTAFSLSRLSLFSCASTFFTHIAMASQPPPQGSPDLAQRKKAGLFSPELVDLLVSPIKVGAWTGT